MIYVMSDLHGCYEKYKKMVEKIQLGKEDTLYILGDILDRGPSGLKIALEIAKKENMVLLRGNHDHQAAILLSNLLLLQDESWEKELAPLFSNWLSDGGNATMNEYLKLSEEEQECALNVIRNSDYVKEIEVQGVKYLLAHTVPEIDRIDDYENWTLEDFILGEPDYEEVYFDDKILVTGHTPTGYIDRKYKGRIWKKNRHIAVDCGAVYGNFLGCIRLEDGKEFYV